MKTTRSLVLETERSDASTVVLELLAPVAALVFPTVDPLLRFPVVADAPPNVFPPLLDVLAPVKADEALFADVMLPVDVPPAAVLVVAPPVTLPPEIVPVVVLVEF